MPDGEGENHTPRPRRGSHPLGSRSGGQGTQESVGVGSWAHLLNQTLKQLSAPLAKTESTLLPRLVLPSSTPRCRPQDLKKNKIHLESSHLSLEPPGFGETLLPLSLPPCSDVGSSAPEQQAALGAG